jgi:hypothetical protein
MAALDDLLGGDEAVLGKAVKGQVEEAEDAGEQVSIEQMLGAEPEVPKAPAAQTKGKAQKAPARKDGGERRIAELAAEAASAYEAWERAKEALRQALGA